MRFLRTILLAELLAEAVIAQNRPEAPVESAVRALFDAIHRGDLDAVGQLFSADGIFYSSGGIGGPRGVIGPFARNTYRERKTCALYVRHVQMLTSDAAYVVALRRCPGAPPPHDSGTLDLTMRREPAGWRVTSWREGLLEGVPRVRSEASAPVDSGLLTAEERAEGWISLFDGKSFRGWTNFSGGEAPSVWRIVDGALATVPTRTEPQGLRTLEEFTHFDLRFEWMARENANSGIGYRFFGKAAAMEYQIADDNGDPGARVDPRQRSGALYGVTSVEKSVARPVVEWNDARIRVTAKRIEHWLNGVKTADYPVDVPFASPIALQHHFSEVRFRNLRILRIP